MTAMRRLVGIECAPCRRAGHHCQAQMTVEVEFHNPYRVASTPMCLRCADGDPCFAVTAPDNFETPTRMIEQHDDAIFVPIRSPVRLMRELERIADAAEYAERYYTGEAAVA